MQLLFIESSDLNDTTHARLHRVITVWAEIHRSLASVNGLLYLRVEVKDLCFYLNFASTKRIDRSGAFQSKQLMRKNGFYMYKLFLLVMEMHNREFCI